MTLVPNQTPCPGCPCANYDGTDFNILALPEPVDVIKSQERARILRKFTEIVSKEVPVDMWADYIEIISKVIKDE